MALMLLAAAFGAAFACPPPPASEPERTARERVESSVAVVEATLLLVPPGGLLRVDRVLRGQTPPPTIVIPQQTECAPSFTRIGARGLVILERGGPPAGFVRGELETAVRQILAEPR